VFPTLYGLIAGEGDVPESREELENLRRFPQTN
jgi:hypothetical protein